MSPLVSAVFNLQLTRIDGKVFSVIAESSSQACGICKATPKMMNDLDLIASLPKNEDLYEFGISTLQAWGYMWDIDFQSKSGRSAAWTRTLLIKEKKRSKKVSGSKWLYS